MYFRYFVIISLWKKAWPFVLKKKFKPLYLRMLCAKFCWNWLSVFREEDENVKSLQTDGRTTGDHAEKLTWAFSKFTAWKLDILELVLFDANFLHRNHVFSLRKYKCRKWSCQNSHFSSVTFSSFHSSASYSFQTTKPSAKPLHGWNIA